MYTCNGERFDLILAVDRSTESTWPSQPKARRVCRRDTAAHRLTRLHMLSIRFGKVRETHDLRRFCRQQW